jgi:HlyD family secretion protein
MVGQVAISGTLMPKEEVLVFPQVNGSTIDALLVDVGDTVTAGQVLARLNDRTLTAQLAQARAELARASATVSQARNQITSALAGETQAATALERSAALRRNGTVTQAALDQAIANEQTAASAVASARDGLAVAEAQQQQAQASLDIARLNLERATLRALADGLVSARNGQIGAIAASGGEPIYRIIRDGQIEVEADVIETALGTISVGDPARLRIAGNGEVAGTVRRISPTVDARNRLGTIRIEIASDSTLRTGVFASGEIITVERMSLSVPTTAVLTDSGGTFVLVVADGRLEKRPIVAGLIWNGLREVISGLSSGDVVVARAGAFFADGDEIRPIFPEATAAEGATE